MAYTHTDYFSECISDAAEECGAQMTTDQIKFIAEAVDGARENMSQAFGYDVASSNFTAARDREADELRQRLHYEQTVSRTRCSACKGHGFYRDGWGRDFGCSECDGEGSTRDWKFEYIPRKPQ